MFAVRFLMFFSNAVTDIFSFVLKVVKFLIVVFIIFALVINSDHRTNLKVDWCILILLPSTHSGLLRGTLFPLFVTFFKRHPLFLNFYHYFLTLEHFLSLFYKILSDYLFKYLILHIF